MGAARNLLRGALAGAAATAALDAATYLDMALRGRPASTTPQQTVARLAGLVGIGLPSDPGERDARLTGAGGFLGLAAGTSAGAVVAALRPAVGATGAAGTTALAWVTAMLVGNGPMTLLGVTDPREWSAVDWAADVVPHLAYAGVLTTALRAFEATHAQPAGRRVPPTARAPRTRRPSAGW